MEKLKYKDIEYVLRVPTGFSEDKKYPVVIFLHGAGSRGRDLKIIEEHPFFSETKDFLSSVISVAPQCYENSWFTIFEQLGEFIHHIISANYADSNKIFLVGASMGGYATWQMAMSYPELFKAIIPICGGGMYWNAERFVNMSIWAFHGDSDTVVFTEESEKMVKAINSNGGNARMTIYENCGHDAWTPTFKNADTWVWLLSQK